jgi:hypothetical protein
VNWKIFESFLTLRIIQRDSVINIRKSECKVNVILNRLLINFELSQYIFKKAESHDEGDGRFSKLC